MIEDKVPNWLNILAKGAPGPKPPALGSARIKEMAGRGLLTPRSLTSDEIREMSAAIISHLMARRDA